MADINSSEKKITIKIVYYGPALSGKTTNLMRLHDILDPRHCGELMTFETKGDRTLFFDFLPLMVTSDSGFKVKIKLYTVPGQVSHDATRKVVLSRTDAVVFVADSQRSQSINNFESFSNLEENIGRVGLDFDTLPLVIQFNKRDLANIVSEEEEIERWKPTKLPLTFSSAINGKGVRETFIKSLLVTYRNLDRAIALEKRYQLSEERFLSIIPADEFL